MIDSLIHMDQQWLLAINGAHAPWADALMWQVSRPATWLPLYALMLVLLWYNIPKQPTKKASGSWPRWAVFGLTVLLFAVAVGGADLICARIIKPLVARPRPTHDLIIGPMIHTVNGYTGGAYGFCSNHAANTMAAALLFCLIYTHKKKRLVHLYVTLPLMLWVMLNCYSRMYLGVHYPLDILAGLAVGALMALVAWIVLNCPAVRAKCGHPAGEG